MGKRSPPAAGHEQIPIEVQGHRFSPAPFCPLEHPKQVTQVSTQGLTQDKPLEVLQIPPETPWEKLGAP